MILRSQTLRQLLILILPCFAKQRRDEKEERIISLGLHIVRNLLSIKDIVAEDRAIGDKEELSTLQVRIGESVWEVLTSAVHPHRPA